MLSALLRFLNKDLTGRTREVGASLPYFGDAILFTFRETNQSYWEAEIKCEGKPVCVIINAPDCGEPSKEQTDFARQIVSEPDTAFSRGETLLAREFEQWHKKPLPPDWRTAFKFVGFTVPAEGNNHNDWELSYESLWDPKGHVFTCYFNGGKPTSVTVDG